MARLHRFSFGLLALLSLAACEEFDPPPSVTIANNENGVMLQNPDQPLELLFSEPYLPSSLSVKVVESVLDAEGNLLDEQSPPDLEAFVASTLVAYDGSRPDDASATFGATFETGSDRLLIRHDTPFDWSSPLFLLVEPGLEDRDGHVTLPRKRLPFTYALTEGGPNSLPTGYYYFLMDVEFLATQIQVFAYMDVDPESGEWRAIFTNANRLPELNQRAGCPSCSGDYPICALHSVQAPECVRPSLKQGTVAEFRDFLPEPDPPNGYIFIANGLARDVGADRIAFGTAPFVIDVTIGIGGVNVKTEGTTVTGAFLRDPNDASRWLATGSIKVDQVFVNGGSSGETKGQFTAMTLSNAEVDEIESFGYPIPTL